MGPFRSGLILAAATIAPVPAFADVCERVRPHWDGGPVTPWTEMIALFGSPISLVLLLGTALAVRFRSSWGALTVFVGWSFAVAAVTFFDPTNGTRRAAAIEGCVGSPTLYILVVAAICMSMMLYMNRVDKIDRNPD